MKKIASFLAVLTAAAALAVPAMAHDRDDYNCAPNYGAYNTYNGYDAYGTYGYPVSGSYTVVQRDWHNRNDSRDRGRVANDHRDFGNSRGRNARR